MYMWVQSMQDRRQLVEGYNQLCSGLLDVQVTLSQNKPQTMSDHDRNAAAAKFQNGMQVTCAFPSPVGGLMMICLLFCLHLLSATCMS